MGMAVQLGCEPHLRAFLSGFERVFHRRENREASEAYLLGLLSDLRRKHRDRIAEKVQGVLSPALRQFISDTPGIRRPSAGSAWSACARRPATRTG